MSQIRTNSFGFCGGAYGDEGKGRIVDMIVHELSLKGEVVVYRDNGGANAGHTVEFSNGQRVSLHQLPSGVFIKSATVVLGKEMVIHPGDLLEELQLIAEVKIATGRAEIMIDEMAILSLDTHRAYEDVLKQWQSGGKGSTGRGISPAYADVLLRHPLRLRDIITFDLEKVTKHYQMYQAIIGGLGQDLAGVSVVSLSGERAVGPVADFVTRLQEQAQELAPYVKNLTAWLTSKWADKKCGFVFEKAQAIGLDYRWGVYPDVTASDTTFDGIFSATEGVIDPDEIKFRAAVVKATYMSSVGTRQLPTIMPEDLANRIREDAWEYGSTTKRPRGIAYLDLPALKFFARVGRVNSLVLTHMDVSYVDQPVKICVDYQINGQSVPYRPDQVYLNQVTPVYQELPAWNVAKLRAAKTKAALPAAAQDFLDFLSQAMGLPITMITTGPQREQGLLLRPLK